MREIKFRAWDTKLKKMWSAEEMGADELTINPDGRGFVNVSSVSTRLSEYATHLIPLQFTGLKDKNGKEIYEGDIVMVRNYLNGKLWDGHVHPCSVESIPGGYELKDHWMHESLRSSEVEIIGNIYENPELLTAAEKGQAK